MAIDETEIRLLREEIELRTHERDMLHETIADVCVTLGHEGRDGDDLRDAVGQLERLLLGKDLDSTDLQGIAEQVQRLARADRDRKLELREQLL